MGRRLKRSHPRGIQPGRCHPHTLRTPPHRQWTRSLPRCLLLPRLLDSVLSAGPQTVENTHSAKSVGNRSPRQSSSSRVSHRHAHSMLDGCRPAGRGARSGIALRPETHPFPDLWIAPVLPKCGGREGLGITCAAEDGTTNNSPELSIWLHEALREWDAHIYTLRRRSRCILCTGPRGPWFTQLQRNSASSWFSPSRLLSEGSETEVTSVCGRLQP